MRRFLCTASFFTGEIEVVFDQSGRLVRFDVLNTDLAPVLVRNFKEKLPVVVDELQTAFRNLTIVEADYEMTFDMWWQAYDKKINRKRCEPLWAKLNAADRVKAFYGVSAYNKYLKTTEKWRGKADPEKYLRDRYWENEWK